MSTPPPRIDALEPLIVIGHIHTPFKDPEQLPIQGTANDAKGTIALLPQYEQGLKDLPGFDNIWVLHVRPIRQPAEMLIVPRLDEQPRGVFATRSMLRPNHIGLTCVRLAHVDGCTLHVTGVDMLDGSPVIDIKPYVPRFDSHPESWGGWLENRVPHQKAWQDKAGM